MTGSIIIILKQVSKSRWHLIAPKGHQLGPEYHGEKHNAIEWARNWVSSFNNWIVKIEENNDEKKD